MFIFYLFFAYRFHITGSLLQLLTGCGTTFGLPYVFLSPALSLLVSPHCTCRLSLFRCGPEQELVGRCVAHRFSAGSRVRVPCCLSSCTSAAFSSWKTLLSSLSLVRFDFVLAPWIQKLLPLNISRAVHPQVVHTSRFNMDDCDELIPLWFCRDVVDSEVTSSEHFSGWSCCLSSCTSAAFSCTQTLPTHSLELIVRLCLFFSN